MRYTKLLLVVGLTLALASQAWAVSIPGTEHVKMKFTNWDVGALYSGFDDSGNPYDLTDPNSWPSGTAKLGCPASNDAEDGWGIFVLTDIVRDTAYGGTTESFYNWSSDDTFITGIFWNIHDQEMVIGPDGQDIRATGPLFAFWEWAKVDPNSGTSELPSQGSPNDRTYDGSYWLPEFPGFAPLSTTPMWTGYGVPGGVTDGKTGPVLDDFTFQTFFNSARVTSDGGFYADLGTIEYETDSGTESLTGNRNGQFLQWLPTGDPDYPATMTFEFNGVPSFGVDTGDSTWLSEYADGDHWLLDSDDPVRAVTPELPSAALMLIGLVPMGLAWIRRRKED